MEADESIDFVDSAVVNAYRSVVAKEEYENPPRFHPFIKFAILVK